MNSDSAAPPVRRPGLFRRSPWFAVCLVLVLVKFWLVAAQPLFAIGNADHDDRLFLQLANKILAGEWLGPYHQLTLAKGPMYPLWIAGTFLLGVPLPLAQHLLYLLACVLVVRALRPQLPSAAAAAAVFLVLWWNPMSYEMPALGRVIRQDLYTPAALGCFAALIALNTRRDAPSRWRLAWGFLLGLSGAAVWLTREESIWIVPPALLLVAAAAWNSWRARERLLPLALPLGAAVASATAILVTICALNLHYYGWFGTVEFRSPAFIGAYSALQRVKSSYTIPSVPVTREAREKAYGVSPAFAELRPFLEGNRGTDWAGVSRFLTHRPKEDREIAGGWFMWALRDSVADAGHAGSAGAALDFYARIADEVNRACDSGRLPAYPRRDSLMPHWQPEYTAGMEAALPRAFHELAMFQGFTAVAPPSRGDAAQLRLFRDLTRWFVSPAPDAPELNLRRQPQFDAWRIAALDRAGRALGRVFGVAAYAAAAGWLWLLARACFFRKISYRFVIATALAGGVAAVVVINTLIDVTSFPSRGPLAFAEAYPLVILATALVALDLWRTRRPA
ncbi:MAG TPA: hypothetical protein VHE13_10115 [Opitutus sp.]|nr:hypothetical protein [Opitutus sp.]